jgi:hypothetical protein
MTALAPYGSGMYAIVTNISGSCGTNGMCSFTDTQAAPSSYTVATQQFIPAFWFWPANLVINNSVVLADEIAAAPLAVASQGTLGVSIVADQCKSAGISRQRSPIWISCLSTENSGGAGTFATVLQQQDQSNNGPFANSKGRLNFGKPIGMLPNDLLTLQDSNFAKTLASSGERPSNDAGDMAIGVDQTGGMSQRAATSISEYIGAVPSGSNYQERLTAAAKTFNVPVTVNGNLTVPSGTVTLPVTGTGAQCLHVSSTGVLSGTGADCGSGSGSGAVTVNTGVTSQVALYSGNGTALGGDSALMDNGTTLNYTGPGGITANTGTFSGNLTVNGQLLVAGPWMVSSPVPGTAMAAAATGSSSLGISNDGNFYVSANGAAPLKVLTAGNDAVPTVFGRTGAITATSGDYACAQVTGCTPNTTTVNGHALTGNVTVSANELATGALPNGTTAATQAAGDNSTKVATTAYVDGNYISPVLDWGYSWSATNTIPFNTTTAHMNVFGIYIDRPVRCSSITVYVVTADTSTTNTYDIGLYYGVSGSPNALIAHTGAVVANTYFGTATAFTTIPFGSTVTLMPGRYYLGLYANEASAPLALASNNSGNIEFYHYNAATMTPASGGLPASFTGPVDAFTVSYAPKFLLK